MKSLVTSPSDFLGSALSIVYKIQAIKYVYLLDQKAINVILKNLPIGISEGDFRHAESLKHAVTGCSKLFHAAADYRLWVPDPEMMYDINITGTQN